MKFKMPAEYISCAEVWVEYSLRHFGQREVNTILGDIIKHMTPDRAYEQHYPQLQVAFVHTRIIFYFFEVFIFMITVS